MKEDFEWWISRHRGMWHHLSLHPDMNKYKIIEKLFNPIKDGWPIHNCYMCEFSRTLNDVDCDQCPLEWDGTSCLYGTIFNEYRKHNNKAYNADKIANLPLKYEWIQAIYGKEQKLPRRLTSWLGKSEFVYTGTIDSSKIAPNAVDFGLAAAVDSALLESLMKTRNNTIIESKDDLKQRKEKEMIRKDLRRMEMPKEEMTTSDYLKAHKASGFEIGDKVKVLRSAKNGEQGWNNIWNPRMDDYVGHTFTVTADYDSVGFGLTEGPFTFPWFVLELIEKKQENPIKIDFDTGCLDREVVEQAANSIANKKSLPEEVFDSSYFELFISVRDFCKDITDDFAETDIIERLPNIFKVMEQIIKYRSGWED